MLLPKASDATTGVVAAGSGWTCYRRSVITYTVFDPDDGTGITYWWYRQHMVYVHENRVEVDAFPVGADTDTPTFEAVAAAVEERHAARPS